MCAITSCFIIGAQLAKKQSKLLVRPAQLTAKNVRAAQESFGRAGEGHRKNKPDGGGEKSFFALGAGDRQMKVPSD